MKHSFRIIISLALFLSAASLAAQEKITLRCWGEKSVLWYDEQTDVFYSSRTPYSELKEIFTFEKLDGVDSRFYSTFVMPSGDILFVFDSQFEGGQYTQEQIDAPYSVAIDNLHRKNPIIAVAAEGYKQHIIDFGDRLKPTGWLQNCGPHYSHRYKALYFAEYTRANLRSCNGWKVSGDIMNPDNWQVKASRLIYFPYNYGTKHFHTAQEDPFTGAMYFTTGDRNAAVYASEDGENFAQLDKDDRAKWRMLNAVFTKDYMWWASDDWKENHHFWRCARAENGVIDPEKIEDLFFFPDFGDGDCKATYGNIYFKKYNAILFLDRWDGGYAHYNDLPVYLYDINEGKMIHLTDMHRREGFNQRSPWGFRCRAMEMHPEGNKAVVSFDSFHPNNMYMKGNENGDNLVRNVVLELHKKGKGSYELEIRPLRKPGRDK